LFIEAKAFSMLITSRKYKNNRFYVPRKKYILEIQRKSMQIVPVKFIPESFSRAARLPGILIWHYKERREGEREGFQA
jgi:hypothetical protein